MADYRIEPAFAETTTQRLLHEYYDSDGARQAAFDVQVYRGETVELRLTLYTSGAAADLSGMDSFKIAGKDPDALDGVNFLFESTDTTTSTWTDKALGLLGFTIDMNTAEIDTFLASLTKSVTIDVIETDAAGDEVLLLVHDFIFLIPDVITGNEGNLIGITPSNFSDVREETAHGFAVGTVYRHDGSNYIKAQANSKTGSHAVGIVRAVPSVNTFRGTYFGPITGLSGLTPGALYYVSAATPGALTTTEPAGDGEWSAPVLLAISATEGVVNPYRPSTWITDANGDLSTAQDVAITGALTYPSQVSAFTDLSDTPAALAAQALKVLRVNAGSDAIEFFTLSLVTTLLGLTDAPSTYASQALKYLRVNAGEDAVEFAVLTLVTTLLGLTDTPASYSGQALKVLRVNAGETAGEFAVVSQLDAADGSPTAVISADASGNLVIAQAAAGRLATGGLGNQGQVALGAHLDQHDWLLKRDVDGGSSYNEDGAVLALQRDVTNVGAESGDFLRFLNAAGTALAKVDKNGAATLNGGWKVPVSVKLFETDDDHNYTKYKLVLREAVDGDDVMSIQSGAGGVMIGGTWARLDAPDDGLGVEGELKLGGALNHDGATAGFFATAPAAQPAKASYNNWEAPSDLADALAALGLVDAGGGAAKASRQLAQSGTLGGNQTNIDITSLDINTDGRYLLELQLEHAGGAIGDANLGVYFEADYTATNYDACMTSSDNGGVASAASNDSNWGYLEDGAQVTAVLEIWRDIKGNPVVAARAFGFEGSSNLQDTRTFVRKQGAETNITSVRIASDVASALKTGSKWFLWKVAA